MRSLMGRWLHAHAHRLPLDFRVLYRQFLLRVIDLEALSIEADIPSYLGQFAGILIMISLCHAFGLMVFLLLPVPQHGHTSRRGSLISNSSSASAPS